MSLRDTALLHGHDEMLLQTRGYIFENLGWEVLSTTEIETVERLLCERHIDLLVLCHTLTSQEREDLLAYARLKQTSTKTIVLQRFQAPGSFAEIMHGFQSNVA
jgi:hypothetical protein